MWVINQPEELIHYGVLGMHWGKTNIKNIDNKGPSKKKVKKEEAESKRLKKYKDQGYTDKQSAILSDGEQRAKKALLIVGGIALTAVVAYGAVRYRDFAKDSLIKAGQLMQTVHTDDVASRVANPFYATFKKTDNTIYASKVFSHFKPESSITKFFTKEGIQVASHKSGQKAFKELVTTSDSFREYLKVATPGQNPSKIASAYKAFNQKLVYRTGGLDGIDHDPIHKMFYDNLAKKGYGGVIDVNDSIIEGFSAKPVIMFSNAYKHIVSTTAATEAELGVARAAKGMVYATQRGLLTKPLDSGAVRISAIVGASSMTSYLTNIDKITEYKVAHPKTAMSDNMILKSITNQ